MSATLDPTKEPGTTSVLKVALENMLGNFRKSLETEATMLTEAKAEATAEEVFNPFTHYESKRELLGAFAGILADIMQPYQLEESFTDYLLDKMLPTQDAPTKGENN
jgi:hypothetical protein